MTADIIFSSKCHQRALDSMQASLEAESKSKTEALRMKKKLESDINELEISLDHSNKANVDLQKHIKKIQNDMKDLQVRMEEEQRLSSDYRDQYNMSERRANALHGELEESRTLLEQSDRGRRQAESELAEANENNASLAAQVNSMTTAKRKLEGEMQTLQVSLFCFYFHFHCYYHYIFINYHYILASIKYVFSFVCIIIIIAYFQIFVFS